jgi:hypothetical protein
MTHTLRQQRVWVVFTDETEIAWLRLLRRGFRHCFVLIHDGRHWITLDPLSHRTEVVVQEMPPAFDLPGWLKSQGHVVLRVRAQEPARKPAPLMLFSCVEAVKRVLGVRARLVLTPWQLYKFLQKPRPEYSGALRRGVLSWEV